MRHPFQPTAAREVSDRTTHPGRARDFAGRHPARRHRPPHVDVERTRDAAHGDFATNVALQLAKPARRNPRQLAQAILDALPSSELIDKAELAGPGFINFHLSAQAYQQELSHIFALGPTYGYNKRGAGTSTVVEFVSANPTGPLHVGHGRQAALGDALASLLQSQGYQVSREFYYNDAGVQIQNLALSVQARARGIKPGEPGWPEAAYNGEYIQDVADDFLAKKTVNALDGAAVKATGKVDDLDAVRRFAVAYLRHEQDVDLQKFGVRFDVYYLESSLYTDSKVETTVNALVASGKTYEKDGALWLRTTEYGDDKDRVMRKSDGTFTYFVPDVAYHVTKWQRGFSVAINVQGSDHHGTITRVRAGLQALDMGIPKGYPDYVLHKMVRVMRGGEEVKISKRAGEYVTLARPDRVGRARRRALLSRLAPRRFGVRVRHRPGAVAERRESRLLRAVRACARLQRVPATAGEGIRARSRGRRAQRRAARPSRTRRR